MEIPKHIHLQIWTSGISRGVLRFLEATQACQFSSTQYTVASFRPHSVQSLQQTLQEASEMYQQKKNNNKKKQLDTPLTCNDLPSFVWLAHSENKFFKSGSNHFKKNVIVLGGTNFRGVQIKCDTATCYILDTQGRRRARVEYSFNMRGGWMLPKLKQGVTLYICMRNC